MTGTTAAAACRPPPGCPPRASMYRRATGTGGAMRPAAGLPRRLWPCATRARRHATLVAYAPARGIAGMVPRPALAPLPWLGDSSAPPRCRVGGRGQEGPSVGSPDNRRTDRRAGQGLESFARPRLPPGRPPLRARPRAPLAGPASRSLRPGRRRWPLHAHVAHPGCRTGNNAPPASPWLSLGRNALASPAHVRTGGPAAGARLRAPAPSTRPKCRHPAGVSSCLPKPVSEANVVRRQARQIRLMDTEQGEINVC